MAIIPRAEIPGEHIEFLNAQLKTKWSGTLESQNRLTNWLFTVPLTGIAGTLTYAARVDATPGAIAALILFAAGLVTIVAYGTLMYYWERANLLAFQRDMTDYLKNGSVTWETVLNNDYLRPQEQRFGEFLAWASGILTLYAIIGLTLTVLEGPY